MSHLDEIQDWKRSTSCIITQIKINFTKDYKYKTTFQQLWGRFSYIWNWTWKAIIWFSLFCKSCSCFFGLTLYMWEQTLKFIFLIRLQMSAHPLQHLKGNPEQRFITMDETWVHLVQKDRKENLKQWKHLKTLAAKKAISVRSTGNVMVSIFWETKWALLLHYTWKNITPLLWPTVLMPCDSYGRKSCKRLGVRSWREEALAHQSTAVTQGHSGMHSWTHPTWVSKDIIYCCCIHKCGQD